MLLIPKNGFVSVNRFLRQAKKPFVILDYLLNSVQVIRAPKAMYPKEIATVENVKNIYKITFDCSNSSLRSTIDKLTSLQ